ncbi:uncharacterized protein UTRI_02293 [Ustilago trichophora]|uniref:Uncharacterized protein n=1 Tax=Ustilago trichophora TaxID=86804 RepID=A0A5C3E9Y3_9BASI|nr:uncharacterized protein UTRI_02293 [Ustilago trichophora]
MSLQSEPAPLLAKRPTALVTKCDGQPASRYHKLFGLGGILLVGIKPTEPLHTFTHLNPGCAGSMRTLNVLGAAPDTLEQAIIILKPTPQIVSGCLRIEENGTARAYWLPQTSRKEIMVSGATTTALLAEPSLTRLRESDAGTY